MLQLIGTLLCWMARKVDNPVMYAMFRHSLRSGNMHIIKAYYMARAIYS